MSAFTRHSQRLGNKRAPDTAESVGLLEMRVGGAEPTTEAAERWAGRAEVLARWLLAAWEREQQGGGGG